MSALFAFVGVLDAPTVALAAPVTHEVVVPAEAVIAWVDVEQAGITPGQLVVEQRESTGTWSTVALTTTTFGLHGEFSVAPGVLGLRLTPSADMNPDLAITLLDGDGAVVEASSDRLTLSVGAAVDPGPRQVLGVTGGSLAPVFLAAVILLIVGGGALVLRAWSTRREPLQVTIGMGTPDVDADGAEGRDR